MYRRRKLVYFHNSRSELQQVTDYFYRNLNFNKPMEEFLGIRMHKTLRPDRYIKVTQQMILELKTKRE